MPSGRNVSREIVRQTLTVILMDYSVENVTVFNIKNWILLSKIISFAQKIIFFITVVPRFSFCSLSLGLSGIFCISILRVSLYRGILQ